MVAQYIAFSFSAGRIGAEVHRSPHGPKRDAREIDFLKFQAVHPYGLFFGSSRNLRDSFFAMTDAYGRGVLLYSPAVATRKRKKRFSIFYSSSLTECWQTYGPVAYFRVIPLTCIILPRNPFGSAAWAEIPAVIEEDPALYDALGGRRTTLDLSRERYDRHLLFRLPGGEV